MTDQAGHVLPENETGVLEVRGPNTSVNSACASGGDAIGQALNLMRLGQADCILAGGSEAIMACHCLGRAA